jgi:hypothetical protein
MFPGIKEGPGAKRLVFNSTVFIPTEHPKIAAVSTAGMAIKKRKSRRDGRMRTNNIYLKAELILDGFLTVGFHSGWFRL